MSSSGPPAPALAQVIELTLPDGWPADGFGQVAAVLAQLPEPDASPSGAWVGVTSGEAHRRGLSRLFARKGRAAHLAVRGAALLARGYVDVGGGEDGEGRELAWGRVP